MVTLNYIPCEAPLECLTMCNPFLLFAEKSIIGLARVLYSGSLESPDEIRSVLDDFPSDELLQFIRAQQLIFYIHYSGFFKTFFNVIRSVKFK